MRLHVISPFHTKNQQYFSHCAFTGKSLRFPKMMKQYGYEVIEYSNEGSESISDEHVQILNHDEFNSFYGPDNISSFEPLAITGGPGHICFNERLIEQISNRIEPNDIICHTFGVAHENLKNIFPNNFHVETGIGYPTIMDGTFHIFESYAWLHHYHGIKGTNGSNYQWVVPNYYDLDDWIPNYEHGKYLSFMGRVIPCKGLSTIFAIADNSKYPILIHGHGDHSAYNHPNVKFLGPIFGKDRSDFIRNSRALLAPTEFIEPFCGMAVESMLCGTPVISVDYGAMTETVEEGMGFRCHTLQDWLDAVNDVEKLDRNYIANKARNKYSLEACGKKYDKIFKQLDDLKNKKGWYQINNEVNNYNQHVDYEMEKSFWNDCTNTFGEDKKHYVYARHMNLKQDYYSFDVGGKSILDLGGGPTSMLLKTINLKKGKVIDPIEYPEWIIKRYNSKNIDVLIDIGENANEEGWDEVWIYNCLQHVIDPQKIIENAKKSAKVLRIFEWINIPPHDGHPHCLTKANLDAWIGGSGNTAKLTLAESNCYGECYYGEFLLENDVIDYDQIESEEKQFANRLATWIKENINPKKVVDIGCGPGTYVYSLRDNGINAYGYDIDDRVDGKDYLKKLSLFEINDKSDVVICLEVAEHIETSLSDSIVDSIIRNVNDDGMIIWTAAIPGQGGVGHINCQTKEYWEEKFISRGFHRDCAIESNLLEYIRSGPYMEWFLQNLMIFKN